MTHMKSAGIFSAILHALCWLTRVVGKPLTFGMDGSFAKALKRGEKKYKICFSLFEVLILQKKIFKSIPNAKVKQVFDQRSHLFRPELTFIVYDISTAAILKRCFFILQKQNVPFEVVVVGKNRTPLIKKWSGTENVLWIAVKDKAACDLHMVATRYARGRYITFLRSTDIVHPLFYKCLLSCVRKTPESFVVCNTIREGGVLVGGSIDFLERKSTIEDEVSDENGVFSRLNDSIFHNLFEAERWQKTVSMEYDEALRPWLSFVHTVAYAAASSCVVRCSEALVRETPIHYDAESRRTFALGLKSSIAALACALEEELGETCASSLLSTICLSYVPDALSRRFAATYYSLLESPVAYSHVAFYVAYAIKRFPQHAVEIMTRTFAALNYGRFMASPRVHALHACLIELDDSKPEGLTVYDEQNLPDLKHHLVPMLQEKYAVTYLTRSDFVVFRQLELMAYAVLVSRTALIISSILVHERMNAGRKVVQAWHGSGFLKKVHMSGAMASYPNEYMLASSQACKDVYPGIYGVGAEKILSFGTLQTDRYFCTEAVEAARERALSEFPDLAGKRICFFAPTFRQYSQERGYAEPPSYFCRWDLAAMDEALAAADTAIVFKKHQKLKSGRENGGVDLCDLRDSPRRFVRETALDDIFDWVCGCDVFMTDYSSAMFYPMLLNKPILLYAPDLDEYVSEGNGFYIDYLRSVPGPVVRTPEPGRLVEAIHRAPQEVGSETYQKFKRLHVGSCDGHASERLMVFLVNLYAEEQDF